jgi:amidase
MATKPSARDIKIGRLYIDGTDPATPRVPLFGRSAAFEGLVLDMQNTEAVNFAGNPALAIPIPVGAKDVRVTSLQLVGPRLSEAELLNAGRLIESK